MLDQTAREKEKYNVIWRDYPCYRDCSPGELFVSLFFEGFKEEIQAGDTITDFGCGTANVAKNFLEKGLNVALVDISSYCLNKEIRHLIALLPHQLVFYQSCLWSLSNEISPTSWIYCCDVMEHIPEDKIDIVLNEMAIRMRKGGYFSICLKEDSLGKNLIGTPLHLTVKGRDFWEKKISSHFTILGIDAVNDDFYFNVRVGVLN